MKALYLGRAGCAHSQRAEAFLRSRFDPLVAVEANGAGLELPEELLSEGFDALFAFRSHVIVRKAFLDTIPLCINFHPGPPERRGIGCVNFALAASDAMYGSTCHHMDERIDSGAIIDVRRFRVSLRDTVADVLARTYDVMLCQLYDVVDAVAGGVDLPRSAERWSGPVTRARDMNALREIALAPDSRADLERQARATSFGPFKPYVVLHGHRFSMDDPAAPPRVA